MNECPALVDGTPDSVAAASAQIRLLMVEGDGPPGPWSDTPRAASVRRGDFNALSGDFVEEVLPCFGVGIGRVIGKRGATVMRLQDESGARIDVRPDTEECVISGTAEQVAIAADAIRDIIEEGDKARGPRYGDRDDGYGDRDDNDGYNDQRGRERGEMTEEVIPVQPDAFGTVESKALATSSPTFETLVFFT